MYDVNKIISRNNCYPRRYRVSCPALSGNYLIEFLELANSLNAKGHTWEEESGLRTVIFQRKAQAMEVAELLVKWTVDKAIDCHPHLLCLSSRGLAEHFGVAISTVRMWVRFKKIKYFKDNGRSGVLWFHFDDHVKPFEEQRNKQLTA